MLIKRTSLISGIEREKDLPITEKQLKDWKAGTLAQVAFHNLSAGDREFIMTGIVDEEWDSAFGGES